MSADASSLFPSAAFTEEQRILTTRYGIEARCFFGFRGWNEIEPELGECWRRNHEDTGLSWLEASEYVYAAWSEALPDDAACLPARTATAPAQHQQVAL